MKNLFLLLLSMLILTACGLAEPTDPLELDPDETAPNMVKSEPINKGTLAYDDDSISLTLDETIKPSSLETLNKLQITSTDGSLIEGTWSFDERNKKLTFALNNREAIPQGQQFTIAINGEITDEAGNELVATLQINTPKLFNITITATGLTSEDSITIAQSINGQAANNDILVDENNKSFLATKLKKGDEYVLNISQSAQKSFCSLSSLRGQISTSGANIEVKCHAVVPTYPAAGDWNQYYATNPNAHGGERKTFIYPNAQSCSNLKASDALGAFNWVCSENPEDTSITFTSIGFKPGKILSSLVNFDIAAARWKENRVLIKNGESIIHETISGIWWNNPVIAVTKTTNSNLSIDGGIYLVLDELKSNRRKGLQIKANGIALLINPEIVFFPRSINAGVQVEDVSRIWVEGKIDASSSQAGLKIASSTLVILQNLTLENAQKSGVNIENSEMIRMANGHVTNNKAHGIHTVGSNGVRISNTVSSKNTLSGIIIASNDTTLIDVKSLHNQENGILVTGNTNKLFNIFASNNLQDGLVIAGAANNIVNTATITSNDSSGLRLTQTAGGANNPRGNLLSNITIANNASKGIFFEIDENQNNRLINVLDAYNGAASECPDTDCNNDVKVILENNISLVDLFSPVEEESNVVNYGALSFLAASKSNAFDNVYRVWGAINGSGACSKDVFCALFDWSLNLNDTTFALNQFNPANTSALNTHSFVTVSEPVSFLSNSIEILDDSIGNDNGLCEADEACVFAPNIGSYQGHGNKILLPDASNLNATRVIYENNGR